MEYAKACGVPGSDIILEEKSTITEENIKYAGEILRSHNLSTVLIVSDPLHMKRAMLIAKDYGLNAYPAPTATTRYVSFRTKAAFLAREVFFYIGYKICG